MKKLLLLVLLLISVVANAQKGISYQAVILDPSKIEIPGQDISGQPYVNGNVNVKFVILSGTTSQFEEVQQTKTDAYGLVNLTIGSVASTTFNALTWDANQKSLQVFVSFNNGASYTKVSDQKLTYTPYALFSETAGKLGGTLEIVNGGTGATTAVGARSNLGLGNVDNTTDAAKPISTATQAALDLKASSTDLVALSATVNTNTTNITSNTTEISLKAPIASPTFTGTVSGVTKSMVGLGSVDNTTDAAKPISEATQTALDLKASTADLLALSATVNTNTASITSHTTEISLKAPIASPTFTGITTATGYKIPNGTSSEYLMADGSVSTSSGSLSVNVGTSATGVLPIANGGTGSSTKNFVDLFSSQSIGGGKSFSDNLTVKGMLLGSPDTGAQNTMLGTATFVYGTPGDNNTALGFFTLSTLNGGSNNTAVGTNALRQTGTGGQGSGNRNTAVGSDALSNGLEASDNVGVGISALRNTTGGNNVALGNYALYANTSGSYNTANGSSALQSNTTGYSNAAIGYGSLQSNTTGINNTANGAFSLFSNISGQGNTANGHYSLYSNTTGIYNVAAGSNSLFSNTIGSKNTANGHNALSGNISGSENTSTGFASLQSNTTGTSNTANGYASLDVNSTGSSNTAAGSNALVRNTTGSNNTANGYDALSTNTSGSNNTAIGYGANVGSNNLTNSTAIGNGAVVTASDAIQLGNTSVTNVKTSGTITAGDITYPKAHGTSGQVLSTTGSGTLTWTTPTSVTVGTISSTSNANGATITAGGVLNLAPADATNGGIVTNGVQTFAGDKTFNGNLNIGTLSAGVLDINTYTSYSSNYADPGLDSRQTFTAATSGYLTKLTLKSFSTVSGVIIEIYKAANITSQNSIGGTLLFTSNPINFIYGDLDILFSSGIKLDVGQVYMFRVISNSTLTLGKGYTGSGNPYLNPGLTYSWPSYYTGLNHPYAFKTYISQKNGGNLSAAGALTGDNTATSTISGFSANMNTQTGTSYTLLASDNGKIITLNNASAITLTVPALFTGFNCMIVQLGAGEVTLTPSGTTISNRSSYTKTAGTNAIVSLIGLSGTTFISAGDMR